VLSAGESITTLSEGATPLIPPTPCVISANLPAQAVRSVSVASNSHGKLSMGINTTVSFVKAATRGNLYAEAQEQAINRKLASYHVHCRGPW
jgi:acyl-coenzyme A thioesterase PaaI-like protein